VDRCGSEKHNSSALSNHKIIEIDYVTSKEEKSTAVADYCKYLRVVFFPQNKVTKVTQMLILIK